MQFLVYPDYFFAKNRLSGRIFLDPVVFPPLHYIYNEFIDMYLRGKGEADEKNNDDIFFVDDHDAYCSRVRIRGWR